MTLVVESGLGLSTAESYLSAVDLLSTALSQGLGYLNPDDGTSAWLTALQDGGEYDDLEAALRRGTVYLEGRYFDAWRGYRATAEQALAWPRAGVLKPRAAGVGASYGGYAACGAGLLRSAYGVPGQPSFGRGGAGVLYGRGGAGGACYPATLVPAPVLLALVHAALREYVAPGALLPDFVAAQMVASESVGPVSTSYLNFGPVGNAPTLPQVDQLLRPLLLGGGGASTGLMRG